MHGRLYNEAEFRLRLRPRTPILIKSGASTGLDPAKPDMAFVRTGRVAKNGIATQEVYLPGSSLRGVLRAHAESLLRSVDLQRACDPFKMSKPKGSDSQTGLRVACLTKYGVSGKTDKDPDDLEGYEAWKHSCYACRLFGNTGLASRVRVGDFYVQGDSPLTEARHGVAIDRITGAVAQGPFELETVTDGEFAGIITLRNFTTGQLGLLAATMLDLSEGVVPIGHAKSRGLGRVQLTFDRITFRFLRALNPERKVKGIGALADQVSHEAYNLPKADDDCLDPDSAFESETRGAFSTLTMRGRDSEARDWLDKIMTAWVAETSA